MRLVSVVIVVGCLAAASMATAQSEAVGDYDELVAQGVTHFKAGEFSSARVEFEKAYALNAEDATLLLNIGSCFRREQRFEDAVVYYEKFLAKSVEGDNRRALVRDTVKQLRAKLQAASASQVQSPTADRESPSSSTVMWTGLGVASAGLAAFATAGYFGWRVKVVEGELESSDVYDEALYREGERAERNTLIFAGIGAVCIVGGGTLWFLGRGDSQDESVTITPKVSADRVGFSLSGRF